MFALEINWIFFSISDRNCDEASAVAQVKCSEGNEVLLISENGAEKNEICQNSANNDENIRTDQSDDSGKVDSESISQEHVNLEALENTKIAMAQFAAAALSKGANENSVKDLTMLQSALFTLQHQQVFQMQLIEQLQYQLAKNSVKRDKKHCQSLLEEQQIDESEKETKDQLLEAENPVDDDVSIKNSDER